MRSLSSTLLQAQQSPSRRPFIWVEVVDRVAGVARLGWSRLYTGSEPDNHHAATVPGDGSLVRARVEGGNIHIQRVANPGPGSDFSSWSLLGQLSSNSGIALSSRGSEVMLFHGGNPGNSDEVFYRRSTDYGQSFGSATSLGAPFPTTYINWLAAAYKPDGKLALFALAGGYLYGKTRSAAGSWSGWSSSGYSWASASGLASCYQGDWNLLVAGKKSGDLRGVWGCVYGDGYSQPAGSWSSLEELIQASSASQVEFRCPSLAYPDVFRAFFVEKYTGQGSYSRPCWCHSPLGADFISNLWREPVPFNLASEYGLALAPATSYLFLSCPFGVWRAPLTPASLEVSGDVVGLSLREGEGEGRVRLELDNSQGQYNGIGSASSVIREGSEVRISPGYTTSLGQEVSSGPVYWVEGWEYGWCRGRGYLTLELGGGWSLLQGWRARRQFAWSGSRNIFQLLSFILARAGLGISSLGYSSTMGNLSPNFTIHPGEMGEEALRGLLAMVPDVLFFRGATAYVEEPLSSEASAYSYGVSHPLLSGRYSLASLSVNWVQVYGQGVMGEGFSWEGVEEVYDRLKQVHDLNLTTLAQAQERGQTELRKQEMASRGGEILVPVNCGQELYDVVEVTDSRLGLAAEKRRVRGLALDYSPHEGRYEQRLLLGGV